jgi:hypothetical protein
MPVSFCPSQEQVAPVVQAATAPATAPVAPVPADSAPRTTQFFADRTRPVLVGDQGAIGRWGLSGNMSAALSQESREQEPPVVGGNPLAMRFRAVYQKPSPDADQVMAFFILQRHLPAVTCGATIDRLSQIMTARIVSILLLSHLGRVGECGKTLRRRWCPMPATAWRRCLCSASRPCKSIKSTARDCR